MLRDVPIVASRAGAIQEVVDDGRCGLLIDPASVDSLVSAIDSIRMDAELRHGLVQAARTHVARAFDLQRMGDEVCQLYADLSDSAEPRSEAAA